MDEFSAAPGAIGLPVEKAKNGRPSQYDEKLGARILDAMRAGFTLERASEYIGINPGTVQGWTVKRAEFGRLVKKARREHEMNLLRSVESAGEKSWQARAWILERTHGYAQPSARLQVTQEHTHGISGNLAQLLAGIAMKKKAQVIDCQPIKPKLDAESKDNFKQSKYNNYSATNTPSNAIATSTSNQIADAIIDTHKQTLLKIKHKRMRLRKPRAGSLAKYPPTTTPPATPPAPVVHA